ncbi:MAG: methyltransferase domain-containing [Lasallia pustulata]|uniref:Methyltransferase domain-containing n=1 Tax=Lasallia pustulata TaxID=136370 RepID=A0A5M8PCN5_9LECA|nr:MAG: methyltransferase domain-containing [Lasallia pustulata]
MAETGERACSDTAYLGYEYPALGRQSFADPLANQGPHLPAALDASHASLASHAAAADETPCNDGHNGPIEDIDGDASTITTNEVHGNTRDNFHGDINSNSKDDGPPDPSDRNDIDHDIDHDGGHDGGDDFGQGNSHDAHNEDDIEVGNDGSHDLGQGNSHDANNEDDIEVGNDGGHDLGQGNSHDANNEDDIEVDNFWDGEDSTFGDGSSYGDSVLSDIMRHRYENGRRYHSYKEGRYLLPNDEEEMDREDMKHHMNLILMDGRLHLAPIGSKPSKILDVGTGTGIWAIEMGETYPTAEITPPDLSPIQPTWIPPNVRFEIDDVEEDWLYTPSSYDFIHFRFLFLAIKNLPRALNQAMRTLKPGGWIELCELDIVPVSIDGAPPETYSQILAFNDTLSMAALQQGCDLQIAPKFKSLVTAAGYEEVTEEIFTVPWGSWPREPRLKEAGAFLRAELRAGLQGISMALFTRSLGWTAQEVELFLIGVRKDLDNNRLHLCSKLHCVYGRKPLHAF